MPVEGKEDEHHAERDLMASTAVEGSVCGRSGLPPVISRTPAMTTTSDNNQPKM